MVVSNSMQNTVLQNKPKNNSHAKSNWKVRILDTTNKNLKCKTNENPTYKTNRSITSYHIIKTNNEVSDFFHDLDCKHHKLKINQDLTFIFHAKSFFNCLCSRFRGIRWCRVYLLWGRFWCMVPIRSSWSTWIKWWLGNSWLCRFRSSSSQLHRFNNINI